MTPEDIVSRIKARRRNFFNFRWLLLVWLSVLVWYRAQHGVKMDVQDALLLGAVLLSQVALWRLPLKYFEGLSFFYAIFLLDLNFILLGFWLTNEMQTDIIMALFLGIFFAALAKDVTLSIYAFVVIAIVYVTLKARTPEGFDFSQTENLLKLPFLFIASVHSGLVAHEAADELEIKKQLHSERESLASKIKGTFVEIAKFGHDVKLIFNSLPFALVVVDLDGRVTVFNHMAEYIFGLPHAHVLGTKLREHPILAEFEEKHSWVQRKEALEHAFVEIPSAEGQSLQMSISSFPVRDERKRAVGTLLLLTPIAYFESMSCPIHGAKDPDALKAAS